MLVSYPLLPLKVELSSLFQGFFNTLLKIYSLPHTLFRGPGVRFD